MFETYESAFFFICGGPVGDPFDPVSDSVSVVTALPSKSLTQVTRAAAGDAPQYRADPAFCGLSVVAATARCPKKWAALYLLAKLLPTDLSPCTSAGRLDHRVRRVRAQITRVTVGTANGSPGRMPLRSSTVCTSSSSRARWSSSIAPM